MILKSNFQFFILTNEHGEPFKFDAGLFAFHAYNNRHQNWQENQDADDDP